jgi:YD repeat-containing protein
LNAGDRVAPVERRAYDQGSFAIGKLSQVSDESGSTTFTYDGLGHVTGKTQTVTVGAYNKAFVIGYGWGSSGSANGKLQTLTYPSGAQVTYGFDAAGRINAISVLAGGVSTTVLSGVGYTANGQPQGWVWGDSTPYQRTFDGYGRLASYPLGNPAGTSHAAGVMRTLIFDAEGGFPTTCIRAPAVRAFARQLHRQAVLRVRRGGAPAGRVRCQ